MIHVYSNETGKDVAQIPLTKLADLLPKSIYAFDIPNEIARVKRYKEYAEYCLKQLEQRQKEG